MTIAHPARRRLTGDVSPSASAANRCMSHKATSTPASKLKLAGMSPPSRAFRMAGLLAAVTQAPTGN